MTRVAALLAVCAVAALVAGVVMLSTPGWGLITAGALMLATAVMLYDPEDRRRR